jgi:hypothetical protein
MSILPIFKTTSNIFKDYGEFFEKSWLESDKTVLPPRKEWDYSRPLTIEDVDFWEVIYEASGGRGIYASWSPYAEFYMIKYFWTNSSNDPKIELYYGPMASKKVYKRAKELNMPITEFDIWVEPEELWLYTENKDINFL